MRTFHPIAPIDRSEVLQPNIRRICPIISTSRYLIYWADSQTFDSAASCSCWRVFGYIPTNTEIHYIHVHMEGMKY